MPVTPTADFSFDRDIAPYAGKYFDRIAADRSMSHEQKMRLQGNLLGGVEAIEAQRLKLQEERDMGRKRKLDYEYDTFRLEDARAARTRLERDGAQVIGAHTLVKGILASPDDPYTKAQKLAEAELEHAPISAANRDVGQVFNIARAAIPKTSSANFTPHQIASMTAKLGNRVHPDDLPAVLSDPVLLGQALAEVAKDEEAAIEAKKLADDQSKEAKAAKLELAKMPLKFAKDIRGDESDWLEDSSTAVATKVVEVLGTPEEKARFAKLKTASSDRERALMVELIQLRHRFDTEKVEGAGRKSASSVTGW